MNAVAEIKDKAEIKTGGALAALVPESIDEAYRLSQALARAGDMVPKHFQNKPDMVMAAVVRGMEIGLAPMQALSNIAVINGRSSLWGDALPALMQRAGHHIDVEIGGDGDQMVATATLTRGDTGKEVVRTFSVDDARKANLWGKQGPWQTYPKRMLMHRARSWAVRDGASDALMGLQVAEEVQDYAPIKDVTPPGGFAAKAAEGREAAKPIDAEVTDQSDAKADNLDQVDDTPPDQPDDLFIEDAVDMTSEAYSEGVMAFQAGTSDANSYEPGTGDWNDYEGGYREAAAQAETTENEGQQ